MRCRENGRRVLAPLLSVSFTLSPSTPVDRAGELLAAAARLGNADARFVAGPVGIIA